MKKNQNVKNFEFDKINKYALTFDDVLEKYKALIGNSAVHSELANVLSEKDKEVSRAEDGSNVWQWVINNGNFYLMAQSDDFSGNKIGVITTHPKVMMNVDGKVKEFKTIEDLVDSVKVNKNPPLPELSPADKKFMGFIKYRDQIIEATMQNQNDKEIPKIHDNSRKNTRDNARLF